MPDTTPLSIAEQLARYGDAVEAMHGPVDRRHSTNGGPVAIVELRAGNGMQRHGILRADVVTVNEAVTHRRYVVSAFAAALALLLCAAVILLVTRSPLRIVSVDDSQSTSTTVEGPAETTSTEPGDETQASVTAYDLSTQGLEAVDEVPVDMMVLSDADEWLPFGIAWDPPRSESNDREVPIHPDDVSTHLDGETNTLFIRFEEDLGVLGLAAPSIEAAVVEQDPDRVTVRWAEGTRQIVVQAIALDGGVTITADALKGRAASLERTADGWRMPETTLISSGDDVSVEEQDRVGAATIAWAPAAGWSGDLAELVVQRVVKGNPANLFSALYATPSDGDVRLTTTADGSPAVVVGGLDTVAMAVVGDNLVTWYGPGALPLMTDARLMSEAEWVQAWSDSPPGLDAEAFVGRELEAVATPMLPDLDFTLSDGWARARSGQITDGRARLIHEVDTDLLAAGPPLGTAAWYAEYRREGSPSEQPDVWMTTHGIGPDIEPPRYCVGDAVDVSVGLGSVACGRDGREAGSVLMAWGDGYVHHLVSPVLSLVELIDFVDGLTLLTPSQLYGSFLPGQGYEIYGDTEVDRSSGTRQVSHWQRGSEEVAVVNTTQQDVWFRRDLVPWLLDHPTSTSGNLVIIPERNAVAWHQGWESIWIIAADSVETARDAASTVVTEEVVTGG